MNWGIYLAIASLIVTIISFVYAIRQNRAKLQAELAEKRMRDIYQNLCRSKCITLIGTARELTNSSVRACELVANCASESPNGSCASEHVNKLTGYIYAVRTSTNHLIDNCKVIGDEYMKEFNEPVSDTFEEQLQLAKCAANN